MRSRAWERSTWSSKPTDVAWNRRTWEIPRVSTSELKTYRAVVSLDGTFEIGQRYFDWDVGYQYNRNERTHLLLRQHGPLREVIS